MDTRLPQVSSQGLGVNAAIGSSSPAAPPVEVRPVDNKTSEVGVKTVLTAQDVSHTQAVSLNIKRVLAAPLALVAVVVCGVAYAIFKFVAKPIYKVAIKPVVEKFGEKGIQKKVELESAKRLATTKVPIDMENEDTRLSNLMLSSAKALIMDEDSAQLKGTKETTQFMKSEKTSQLSVDEDEDDSSAKLLMAKAMGLDTSILLGFKDTSDMENVDTTQLDKVEDPAQLENLEGILKKRYEMRSHISQEDENIDKALSLVSAYKNCLMKTRIRCDKHVEKESEYFKKINVEIAKLKGGFDLSSPEDRKASEDALKNIEKLLKKCALEVAGINSKDFKTEYHKARALHTPSEVRNNNEQTTRHSHAHSLNYLTQRNDGQFNAQVNFMQENTNFLRVSELKGANEMQGMAVNAHEHTVGKDSVGEKSCFRSGAFAVHGRHEVRKAKLLNEKNELKSQLKTEKELLKTQGKSTVNDTTKKLEKQIKELDMQIKGVTKGKNKGIDSLMKNLKKFEEKEKSLEAKIQNLKDKVELSEKDQEALEKLEKEKAHINNELRKELGFASLDELRAEISMRRDLCISQALPELIASVMKTANNQEALQKAIAAGSFLHVAESLLSHLNGSERAMIEDMKGTLDYLSENTTIEFDKNAPPSGSIEVVTSDANNPKITQQNPKINIKLPLPKGVKIELTEGANPELPASEQSRPNLKLGLTAICFNTAVNEEHSLHQLLPKQGLYQEEMLADGLNKLSAYENKLKEKGLGSKELDTDMSGIREHYSEKGSRDTKDLTGMDLRINLIKNLGGQIGFKCKSGKDRTGALVCKYLAGTKAEFTKLLGGISHYLTGINTGKLRGYAFSAFQRLFIPKEIVPEGKFCKKVNS